MAISCYVIPDSITWSVIQPGSIFSVEQESPCLILNYNPQVEMQVAEKILKPFAKEEDVFVNIVDNRNGTSEISLYFVVDCSPPPDLDFRSAKKALFINGKGITSAMRQKAIKEKKMTVQRFVSGREVDFSTGDVRRLLQLKNRVGYFLIGIGIETPKGSLAYSEWHLRKREISSSREKFRQVLEKRKR